MKTTQQIRHATQFAATWCAGFVLLLFITATHAASNLASIDVQGASRDQKDNLLAHLGDIERDQLTELIRLTGQLQQKSEAAMQALGYFNAEFTFKAKDEKLIVLMKPGPPTTITHIKLELTEAGLNHPGLLKVVAANPLEKGNIFASKTYENFKRTLLGSAHQAGFIEAHYDTQSVVVNRSKNEAVIDLQLNTGAQYRFGSFSSGGGKIATTRINQLVAWQENSEFSLRQLNVVQKRLLDTGYFQSVVLERNIDHDHLLVHIHAKLVMAKSNKLITGIGFATDTGPRARLGWAKPWVNAAGHSMKLEVAGSTISNSFTSIYQIPSAKKRESYWSTEFSIAEEDYEDTRSSRKNIGVGYVAPLGRGWKGSLFAKYALERYTQGNDRGRSELLLPGFNLNTTKARGGMHPVSGYRYSLTVEGANDGLLSDASFFRLNGNTRWLQSYGKHRLLGGIQLGGIFLYGSTHLDDIPSSLRFFAGGDQSIRGYDYKSIAPRGPDNELVGGKYLATARAEYGYRFAQKWRAALFVDGGSAFNKFDDRFFLGPGAGLHWLSPIGAMRFDIGFAASEDQDFELHISLGPEL